MNDSRLIHRCDVQRESATVGAGGDLTLVGYTTVIAGLHCLLESMNAWRQRTVLGEVTGSMWHLSWGAQVLQDEDRLINVTDKNGVALFPGKAFLFKSGQQDTIRPAWSSVFRFQTGHAEEIAMES